MKLQPIRRYPQPHFPTRDIVDADPDLLRLLPKRWQTNSAVVAALAACIALSGCGKRTPGAPSHVAPIFLHGEGRGAAGCVSVNPPVFLSEAEARTVIIEEAKRAGIHFAPRAKVLSGVYTPVTTTQEGFRTYEDGTRRVRIVTLDGFDKKRSIGFEFVSREDFLNWKGREWGRSSAADYDLIGAAKVLREGLSEARPAGAYAVFYDPSTGWADPKGSGSYKPFDSEANAKDLHSAMTRWNATAKGISREQLRAQAKDFIKWLKAQGVI